MLDLLFSNPILFVIVAASLIGSLSLHEFGHALAADKLGDPTPRLQGRLSLNPTVHLDPLGTLALLVAGFGWGKPVQFDPFNLQHPVRDSAIIAAVGPLSNIIIALTAALLLRIPIADMSVVGFVAQILVTLNLSLAIFNLIPIYPLDGSRVLTALLPQELGYEYEQVMSRYGFMILLLLILPVVGGHSAVSALISPVINFLTHLLIPG